jgi:hypothetical protein
MDEELRMSWKKDKNLLSLIGVLLFLASLSVFAGIDPIAEYPRYVQKTQMLREVFVTFAVLSFYSVLGLVIQFVAYTVARLAKREGIIEKETPIKSIIFGLVANLFLTGFQALFNRYIPLILLALAILTAVHIAGKKGVTFKYYMLGGFITSISIIFITAVVPLILSWLR